MTRSQTAFAAAANDENSQPAKSQNLRSKRTGLDRGLAAKPNVNRKSTRTALGDISNRVQKNKDDQMPKKKRVVDVVEKVEPPAVEPVPVPGGVPVEARNAPAPGKSKELAALMEDVDMKEDSDNSLEEGVAELHLSAVDAADVDDPQAVAEYIHDIMDHMKETESLRAASSTYMSKQTDINSKMREILIDWLVEVHLKFKLRSETLYLTVNVIDRFLARRAVSRTKLQLVGCTAMFIASKYEEIYAPEVKDFVYISDKAYTRDQILNMESIMLNTLGFHLTIPTCLRFGERFVKVAGASTQAILLTKFMMELTMQDYKLLKYLPSEIASAAVYLAMKTTTGVAWNSTLEHHTGYSEAALKDVLTDLYALVIKDPPKYKAVRKKYLHKRFMEVGKMTVAVPF